MYNYKQSRPSSKHKLSWKSFTSSGQNTQDFLPVMGNLLNTWRIFCLQRANWKKILKILHLTHNFPSAVGAVQYNRIQRWSWKLKLENCHETIKINAGPESEDFEASKSVQPWDMTLDCARDPCFWELHYSLAFTLPLRTWSIFRKYFQELG